MISNTQETGTVEASLQQRLAALPWR